MRADADESSAGCGLWQYGLIVILVAQSFVFGLRVQDGFYDGKKHVNWSPPFWLMKGQAMHKVNFWTEGYAGVVSEVASTPSGWKIKSWYASHPQLIAIPIYAWTGLFGYAEWSARTLTIFTSLITTILLWFASRERFGARRATVFVGLWAALPVIVNYGRSLEHEPFITLFLSLAFLGHEKVLAGKRRWHWAWLIAIIGMLWSDWSGFVFAGLFGLAQLAVAWHHRPTRDLLRGTVLGGLIGGMIVGVQTHLTTAQRDPSGAVLGHGVADSLTQTVGFAWGQYYGRSGRKGGVPWGYWFQKQVMYWFTNFTRELGLLGLLGGLWAFARDAGRRRWLGLREQGLSLRDLLLLTALGTLIYAVVLRDATAVHIFYQYFYSLFVAWGLAECLEWLRLKTAATALPAAALAAWIAMIAVLSHQGLTLVYTQGWGGPAEAKLLGLIRGFPPGTTVAMIGTPEDDLLNYPNVEYYTGQRISFAYPEDAVKKDLVLLAPGNIGVQAAALNRLAAPAFKFQLRGCAPALCLWVKAPA